jgi:prepilin-type N-terminal cleavage/methylation domain-containing protein
MHEAARSHRRSAQNRRIGSFTLIELLTVMAIIAILVGLTLAAANGVWTKAARSRAASEIQAMSTALEGYKTDNGIYPPGNITAGASSILLGPPSAGYEFDPVVANSADYQNSSGALYLALSGQASFNTAPTAGVKSYMSFKINQIGNPAAANSYIKDPWNNSYGYSTGDNKTPQVQYPYNGTGFFDLWSTAGTTTGGTATNTWISNWQ